MEEIWKDIVGYEGLYQVSNLGNVRSVKRKVKLLRHGQDKERGYKNVILYRNGTRKMWLVHRLVAIAFVNNPENKPQIDHIDGNPSNNVVTNLRWCTVKENLNFELAHRNRINSHTQIKGKKIKQFTQNGDLINEWDSISSAARFFNITREGIRDCCLGKQKTAFGYIWKYKE